MIMMSLIITVVAVYCVYRMFYKKDPLSGIPGPKGIPVLGNMLQIDLRSTHLYLANLARTFGDVFCLSLLGTPVVIVNSKKGLYEMLVHKGKDFAGRQLTFITDQHSEGGKMTFNGDPSPIWHKGKKIIFKHVRAYSTGLKDVEQLVVDVMTDTISDLKSMASDVHPIQLDQFIKDSVAKITFMLVFDNEPDKHDINAIHEFNDSWMIPLQPGGIGEWLNLFPWLRYFGHPTWKQMKDVRRFRWRVYEHWKNRVMQQRKENQDLSGNLLHNLLETSEGKNKEGLTDEYVHCIVWQVIAAAAATTSSALRCLFNILVHYPEVQRKLREEMVAKLGNRSVTIEDRNQMPYHYATVLETMRYACVFPVMSPHKALVDSELCGYKIKRDTIVWGNVWYLAHDEKLWDDPWSFYPERFIDEQGCLVPADHPARVNSLAFGAGVRVCPGEVFALSRMFLILAMMIQNFEILPATTIDEQPSCDCRDMISGLLLDTPPYKVRINVAP